MKRESLLNFFTIGIGPSSSHTVGPMKAAQEFLTRLSPPSQDRITRIECHLFGSLAATGKGHQTDKALMLGFLGYSPETIPIEKIPALTQDLHKDKTLLLPTGGKIHFDPRKDIFFHRSKSLPRHPNGMHFQALDGNGQIVTEELFYSLGGGFIATEKELSVAAKNNSTQVSTPLPYPYATAAEVLFHCKKNHLTLCQLALANEDALHSRATTESHLAKVWKTMQACIENGCHSHGTLPGGLKVSRRAPDLYQQLSVNRTSANEFSDHLAWVNLAALAVNEENAAGGRVVTAPTNGAAGIIPAVLSYANRFHEAKCKNPVQEFLLTAALIANLYKQGASLSGADVGCQGEVGVACSMAAGALTAYLGGTPAKVAQAAEIGMEHNLGLTCDPIGGLVQIPCIERNAMAAVNAINASHLALSSCQDPRVSLDKVIATMLRTGRDMNKKYKETSRGGLAVNITEC